MYFKMPYGAFTFWITKFTKSVMSGVYINKIHLLQVVPLTKSPLYTHCILLHFHKGRTSEGFLELIFISDLIRSLFHSYSLSFFPVFKNSTFLYVNKLTIQKLLDPTL